VRYPILPAGDRIEVTSSVEEAGKANLALAAVFPLMFLLMLTTIMLQVRSCPKMLRVFATAPLGLIGAVIALILGGQPFGFNGILGLSYRADWRVYGWRDLDPV
jgi:multidrug efflux pump subunit AcrB